MGKRRKRASKGSTPAQVKEEVVDSDSNSRSHADIDEDVDVGGSEMHASAAAEQHGSKGFLAQLRSLISKMKPGDDLTNRSLPATFMAPRSLHELVVEATMPRFYLLIEASLQESPALRMLGVLRYYCMTFFVNEVNKKPFNPVLGETFDAFVRLESGDALGLEPVTDDGAGEDGLTSTATSANADERCSTAKELVAEEHGDANFMTGSVHVKVEQTSHHPPETAFACYHEASGVSQSRLISSTARFLGTTAKVEQHGVGVIRFERPGGAAKEEDTDKALPEHYVYTRTPAIVFRIFRMASEFVGKLSVFCPETGYGATMKFKEKPTIGGSWHDVEGTVWRVTGATEKASKKSAHTYSAQYETVYEITGNWLKGMRVKPAWRNTGSAAKRSSKTAQSEEDFCMDERWIRSRYPALLFEEDTSDAMSTYRTWGECMNYVLHRDFGAANAAKDVREREQRRLAAEQRKRNGEYRIRSFVRGQSALYTNLLPDLVDACGGSLEDAIECLAEIDNELPEALRVIPYELTNNAQKDIGRHEHLRIRALWQEFKGH